MPGTGTCVAVALAVTDNLKSPRIRAPLRPPKRTRGGSAVAGERQVHDALEIPHRNPAPIDRAVRTIGRISRGRLGGAAESSAAPTVASRRGRVVFARRRSVADDTGGSAVAPLHCFHQLEANQIVHPVNYAPYIGVVVEYAHHPLSDSIHRIEDFLPIVFILRGRHGPEDLRSQVGLLEVAVEITLYVLAARVHLRPGFALTVWVVRA